MLLKIILKRNNPFFVRSINDAKKVILAPFNSYSSEQRWKVETKYELSALRSYIQDNHVICDFGIGIGRISKEILEEFPDVRIVGVDSSTRMLNLCKKTIQSTLHDRLQLTPFKKLKDIKTGSVDFAFSIYTLQHLPANIFEQALRELRRIIKQGGYLYLLNGYVRGVVDTWKKQQFYDDGVCQLDVISRYFAEVKDIKYESEYMQDILKTHFSKLFLAK